MPDTPNSTKQNEAFEMHQKKVALEANNTTKAMGTKDAKPLPEFKKLDVKKMEKAVSDDLGLTWGPSPTSGGIVIEHN